MVFNNKCFKVGDKHIKITYDARYDKWYCDMINVILTLTEVKNCHEAEKYWETLRENYATESGEGIDKFGLVNIEVLPQLLKFMPGSQTEQFILWIKQMCKDIIDAREYLAKGMKYYRGNGVEQNFEKAFEYFSKSAELGNIDAQFDLATCYHEGKGVKQNYQKAFEWASKAAEHGKEGAQQYLGDCYYYGRGVEQNFDKAYFWYTTASNTGHADLVRQKL